jgi:cell division initiation protein
MITPIEIRQYNFKRSLRGYDTEEVRNFLQTVSEEWEKLTEDNRKLKSELDKVQSNYENLKELEDMLHKTLQKAEQSSKAELEAARKKAELRVREAESKSQDIIRQGIDERNRLQAEITDLLARRDDILVELRHFLKTQTDRLAAFGRKDSAFGSLTDMEEASPLSEALFGAGNKQATKQPLVDDIASQL